MSACKPGLCMSGCSVEVSSDPVSCPRPHKPVSREASLDVVRPARDGIRRLVLGQYCNHIYRWVNKFYKYTWTWDLFSRSHMHRYHQHSQIRAVCISPGVPGSLQGILVVVHNRDPDSLKPRSH